MTEDNIIHKVSYNDMIQLDGMYQVAHINYGENPDFNGVKASSLAQKSRKASISAKKHIENVIDVIDTFSGTEKNFKKQDRLDLWKNYYFEYVHAFFEMSECLNKSMVTIFVGRHAIELGFKYILGLRREEWQRGHSIFELCKSFVERCDNTDSWEDILNACRYYCEYVEGGYPEYFRFPEYQKNDYFAGNALDVEWLVYNFAIIIMNQIHYLGMDSELDKMKQL